MRRSLPIAAAGAGLLLLALLTPEDARAQPTADEAQAHYDAAIHLLEQRRHAEALVELEHARAGGDTPKVVYNIAFCLKSLSRWAEALRAYERVTELDLNALPDRQRRFVNESIQELRGRVAVLTVRTNVASPTVLVGGAPTSGRATYVDLNASVVVEVRAPGYASLHRSIRPTAAGALQLDLELVPEPRAEAPMERLAPLVTAPSGRARADTAAGALASTTPADSAGPVSRRGASAPRGSSGVPTWLWVGLGVGAIAAGAVVLGLAMSSSSDEPDWTVRGTN